MSSSLSYTTVICDELHGSRLDVALAQAFPEHSRSRIARWIKSGLVTIDNQVEDKPKALVEVGHKVSVKGCETSLNDKAQALPLDIIFEDEHILVINKPHNLVVHPAAGNLDGTLLNAILYHCPNNATLPRAGLVHRLDKDTTGLMVISKSLEAHTKLVSLLHDRLVKREYVALVQKQIIVQSIKNACDENKGTLSAGTSKDTFRIKGFNNQGIEAGTLSGFVKDGFTIFTQIGRHPKNRLKMAVVPGKEATTHLSVLKCYEKFTLIRLKLQTGRTHQIRVHMEHIKHPIVGDKLYNANPIYPKDLTKEELRVWEKFNRQALHACRLSFDHPITQEPMSFEAKIPNDFKVLLRTLEH